MIKVLIGDIFESKAKTIVNTVNTVNCVGVMGKGIALEFKKRFPDMMKDYKAKCDAKLVKPGQPYSAQGYICSINIKFSHQKPLARCFAFRRCD